MLFQTLFLYIRCSDHRKPITEARTPDRSRTIPCWHLLGKLQTFPQAKP